MRDDLTEQLSPAQIIERDEMSRAFNEVFALSSGKRVLFWMLEQCAIYRDAYTGESASTNYALGQQSAGRMLIAKLDEIDPQLYPTLLIAMKDIRDADKAAAQSLAEKMEPEDDDEAF
ncbi:hypothetical protein [Hyphomicrobium sp. ghe19]|uniref:hypothetical protein n=1 Tax=Hyphomicrobium sp. ghe19 TaxID=2682968 RepID=UPI001366E8D6|nr:hypothetical protein HYPP_01951 [Hyphomicrobium sp. ghe19]